MWENKIEKYDFSSVAQPPIHNVGCITVSEDFERFVSPLTFSAVPG
jgi:hypothetical protein